MQITAQNRRLVKVAGSVNLLLLLLCIVYLVYMGYGHGQQGDVVKKTVKFILANAISWIVNLCILVVVLPKAPKWRSARWLFFYLPSLLVTFGLALLISHSSLYGFLSNEPMDSPISGPIFFVVGIDALSLVAIELILSRYTQENIRIENAHMQVENAELRMKSLEAQHEKLKNQLHPHFLFNSLTALKSLIRKDPELAESYVVKLSGFLRFSISHNLQNIVSMGEELKFSLYYLEMQKIRFRNALTYDVQIPEDRLSKAFLPVFSLQLTLENAVKHNRLTQDHPLSISMRYIEPGWLLVENNIQERLNVDPASGIGLKNLSDRYKLLGQENIRVENDAEHFRVYLKIIRP